MTGPAMRDAGNASTQGRDLPSGVTFWSCKSSLGSTFFMTFVFPSFLGVGYPRQYWVLWFNVRRRRPDRLRLDLVVGASEDKAVASLSSDSEAIVSSTAGKGAISSSGCPSSSSTCWNRTIGSGVATLRGI